MNTLEVLADLVDAITHARLVGDGTHPEVEAALARAEKLLDDRY